MLQLLAQTPAAPTPESPTDTTNVSNYTMTNAFETGYRFSEVGGDQGLYRSNVNYGNGLRLLSNSFTANSKEGHGALFDTLLFSTQGLGNDPYGVVTARVEKNELYRYEGTWRKSELYDPFQLNGESGNLKTTQRVMQDHDLTLSATKWLRFHLGYSRNQETGPAVSSYQLYIGGLYPNATASEPGATHGSSLLSLLEDVRRDWNEYRFGADIDFGSFRFTVLRQLSYYKEDSSYASLIPGQPYPEPNTSVATTYVRSAPMHVRSPIWFGNLSTNHKLWAMNGRISYMKSDSNFVYWEAGTGLVPSGALANVSTLMTGAARRPYISGDYSWSVFPTSKLTIVSDTSVLHNRIDGTGSMLQLSTAAATKNIFWGSYMDVARYSESMDLNYLATRWLGVNAGYQYTDRWVDQTLVRVGTTNSNAPGSLGNHLNAGTVGFRLKPLKGLSVSLDAGIGRDNAPYTPTSLADYHTVRGRIDYRLRKLRLSGVYRQLYNLSAPVLYSYDTSHSRTISVSGSYELGNKWWLDASYSKLHIDTFSAIYAELPLQNAIVNVRGYDSIYISNVHSVSILARTQFKRASVSVGYALTLDAGDGRSVQNLGLTDPAAAYLALAQTFPMTYQAPLTRVSMRITPKIQWNAGWEFYRYNQKFAYFGYMPYYRAQTGYTSLSFAF